MNPLSERRSRARRRVDGIWAASPPSLGLAVLDLTAAGAAVESTESLRVGAVYPLRIYGRGRTVSTAGTVRWCKLGRVEKVAEGETLALYRAGISFRTEARPPGSSRQGAQQSKGFRPIVRSKNGEVGRNGPTAEVLRRPRLPAVDPPLPRQAVIHAPPSEAELRQRELDALFD